MGRSKEKNKRHQKRSRIDSSEENTSFEQQTLEKYLEPVKETLNMEEKRVNMPLSYIRGHIKESLYEVLNHEGLCNMSGFKDKVFKELSDIKNSMEYTSEKCEQAVREAEEAKKEVEEMKKKIWHKCRTRLTLKIGSFRN